MKQKWTEMLRIALLCTALHCTRLDCCWLVWIWAILDWNVLRWKGMNGIGRKRIDLNRTELDRKWRDWLDGTGREQAPLNGLDRIKLDWSTHQRSAQEGTEPDSISEDWTGRHCTPLDWTVFAWAWIHQTALHSLHYPGLNWKVPYRTVSSLHLARLICTELHSTFPNETDKDCTALYMNVLHWTRPHRIHKHSTGSNLKGLFWIT